MTRAADPVSEESYARSAARELTGKMREGKNVLALWVRNAINLGYGVFPYLSYSAAGADYLPQPPGAASAMDPALVAEGKYAFPAIKNFSVSRQQPKKEG